MRFKQKIHSVIARLSALPKTYTITGIVLSLGVVFYGVFFFIEKPIQFSYAGSTCVSNFTFLPGLHQKVSNDNFDVVPRDIVKIGNWPIAAQSMCFSPITAPKQGTVNVSIAPYGGVLARQTFAVTVAHPVWVDASVLTKPVSTSLPLVIPLDGEDTTFSYVLKAADKALSCQSKASTLHCDVKRMELVQSQTYALKLERQFKNKPVDTVIAQDVQTLSATTIIDTSIKSGELVFAKPKEIIVVTDKKLAKVEAKLSTLDGDTRRDVPISTNLTDTGFTVVISEDLPRLIDAELTVSRVESTDGSGLMQPYILPFKVSGGPKVSGVNVSTTGVPAGSTVVVSFDQPLLDGQDIGRFITLSGGATYVGKSGNQLRISVASVPKCGDFSIKLTNDIQSNFEIGGQSTWSFSGRTVCHRISTFGSSSQGRPLNAYYFGSGGTTLLYTGAIHGNEVSTKSLMDRWVQELETKARTIPANVTIVVVPMINPDGVARGSRTNAKNVDLNRNFSTNDWQKDITTVGNSPFPGGGGETAMSEPETRAIASLVSRLRPKLVMSYHSIGNLVAANQAGISSGAAATYARLSGYRNVMGQSDAAFEYSVTGTADDWYAQGAGVPSILIELGSHSYHQFERNQSAMWAMVNS